MNPFRSLFFCLARMPAVVMLFIILGLAIVVTMSVMSQVVKDERSIGEQGRGASIQNRSARAR